VYPLFLAFLYYLLQRSLAPVCGDRSAGIVLSSFCIHCSYYLNLRLLGWDRATRLSQNRTDYLRYRTRGSPVDHVTFGPTITAAEVENYQSFCLEVVQPSL